MHETPRAREFRSINGDRRWFPKLGWLATLGLPVLFLGAGGAGAATSGPPTTIQLYKIPASMVTVPAPASKDGPEVPHTIPTGSQLAGLSKAATGQTVDGVQCQTNEQTVSHVHAHVTIFVNGKAKVIPYGIGIPGQSTQDTSDGPFVDTGSCFYWLHTHAEDGIIHVESPSPKIHFSLGQFFKEWGVPLSSTQVGPVKGQVTTFFNGYLYKGNPANLPLGSHVQIQLDVGTPIVAPVKLTNWGQL
jgi:hypothetical protein